MTDEFVRGEATSTDRQKQEGVMIDESVKHREKDPNLHLRKKTEKFQKLY